MCVCIWNSRKWKEQELPSLSQGVGANPCAFTCQEEKEAATRLSETQQAGPFRFNFALQSQPLLRTRERNKICPKVGCDLGFMTPDSVPDLQNRRVCLASSHGFLSPSLSVLHFSFTSISPHWRIRHEQPALILLWTWLCVRVSVPKGLNIAELCNLSRGWQQRPEPATNKDILKPWWSMTWSVMCTFCQLVSSSTTQGAAEVSKVGNYRGGELLCCMDGRANPLMDPKAEALSLSFFVFHYLSLCLSISSIV